MLGKDDAIGLGIIKMKLQGEAEEVDPNGQKDERVKRIRMMRPAEISKESKETTEEKRKQKKATEGRMAKLGNEFKDIFEGVGKYEGPEVVIQLKENVTPVIQPARRIPLHYVKPLEDHLAELSKEDVVEGPLLEEEEGTWISNLVITDKKWDDGVKKTG